MIKAVLFDMDGVIVDSAEANAKYFSDMLNYNGHNIVLTTEMYRRKYYPMTGFDILKSFLPSVSDEKLNDMLKNFSYSGYEKFMKLQTGIMETLESLSRRYKLGVVTNRRKLGTELVLKNFDLGRYFLVIMSREDVNNPKPHPEPLLKALEKLKVEPEESIYVGDNDVDVRAAKAANVKVIIFSENSIKDADYNVNSLIQIPNIVGVLE